MIDSFLGPSPSRAPSNALRSKPSLSFPPFIKKSKSFGVQRGILFRFAIAPSSLFALHLQTSRSTLFFPSAYFSHNPPLFFVLFAAPLRFSFRRRFLSPPSFSPKTVIQQLFSASPYSFSKFISSPRVFFLSRSICFALASFHFPRLELLSSCTRTTPEAPFTRQSL